MVLKLAFGAALAVALASNVAFAQDPAAIVKARQGHYKEIGKASKAIRDELMKPAPDIAVIRAAAKTIDTLAPQIPTWFPPGTGRDVVPKSEALPVIWQKPDEFKKDAAGLATAAHDFDLVGQSGRLDSVRAAYSTLGSACKTCHETFKAKDE
jgi:cytochrome c556